MQGRQLKITASCRAGICRILHETRRVGYSGHIPLQCYAEISWVFSLFLFTQKKTKYTCGSIQTQHAMFLTYFMQKVHFLQDFYLKCCREFLSKLKMQIFMFNFLNYSHLQLAKELIHYK